MAEPKVGKYFRLKINTAEKLEEIAKKEKKYENEIVEEALQEYFRKVGADDTDAAN